MSKYLNVFNTLAEYQAFSASTDYVQPNVALVKETNVLYYDYGNNKPQADMSSYKGEFQDISVGGNYYGKTAITKINYIPSGVTNVNATFQSFSSLKEVACELPSGIKNMNSTFSYCTSLITAPELPSGLVDMSTTFSYCSSLVKGPVIPSGVKNMTAAFQNCSSLKELTFLMITPPTYLSTLNNCSKLETIYVPDESVDTYKTATGWSQFADKFKPLSEKPTE